MKTHHLRRRLALSLLAAAFAGDASAQWVQSAYKDVSLHLQGAAPRMAMRTGAAAPEPLPQLAAHGTVLTWAFATGACGQERWGEFDTAQFAKVNVAAFAAAKVGYIVSTGGEAGIFHCDSDEGMASFLARYDSPQLLGLDFDIEGRQTPEQIDALVQRAAWLHRQRPNLRISFTLATHGASDGSLRSLNNTGERVLDALKHRGLSAALVNLMVMNFGEAEARWCVVADGRCDMGASALQAARNVQKKYGLAPSRIELTAMLGVNDVRSNVFTLADAQALVHGARVMGLAGVHHWSLDRDQACPVSEQPEPPVSPLCHGLPGLAASAFGRTLLSLP